MLYFLIILINFTNLLLQHRAIFWNKPKRNVKHCRGSMKTPFSSNSTTQGNLENNRTHSPSTEYKIKSPDSFLNLTRLFQQWKPTWFLGKISDILLIYFYSSLVKWFHLFHYPEAYFFYRHLKIRSGEREKLW